MCLTFQLHTDSSMSQSQNLIKFKQFCIYPFNQVAGSHSHCCCCCAKRKHLLPGLTLQLKRRHSVHFAVFFLRSSFFILCAVVVSAAGASSEVFAVVAFCRRSSAGDLNCSQWNIDPAGPALNSPTRGGREAVVEYTFINKVDWFVTPSNRYFFCLFDFCSSGNSISSCKNII